MQLQRCPRLPTTNVEPLLVRSYADPYVASDMCKAPYDVIEKGGRPHASVQVGGKQETFTPEETTAYIFQEAKNSAQQHLGRPVNRTVIAVPATFSKSQKRGTRYAASIVGLEVERFISEPAAAALCYGLSYGPQWPDVKKKIVAIHMGAGTTSISVLTVKNGTYTVLAHTGNTRLGGEAPLPAVALATENAPSPLCTWHSCMRCMLCSCQMCLVCMNRCDALALRLPTPCHRHPSPTIITSCSHCSHQHLQRQTQRPLLLLLANSTHSLTCPLPPNLARR